jgi:hypothetical protein
LRKRALRHGSWQLLECIPAFDGNGSFDNFIVSMWEASSGERVLIVVNSSADHSQCFVKLSSAVKGDGQWRLQDLLGDACYERSVIDLQTRGLYLSMAPWQYHVFDVTIA